MTNHPDMGTGRSPPQPPHNYSQMAEGAVTIGPLPERGRFGAGVEVQHRVGPLHHAGLVGRAACGLAERSMPRKDKKKKKKKRESMMS